MKQRLDQRQVQKLILAPALQQAIKLLPLTNLELVEVIDEEMSVNPLLELEEESADSKPAEETGSAPGTDETPASDEAGKPADDPAETAAEEREFEAYFQEYFDDGFHSPSLDRPETPNIENTLSRGATLSDHLTWQANLTFFDPLDRDVAERIIGNLNEDGYLVSPPEEIAAAVEADIERVERVRSQIKMFDPVGCACLDLKECLLAQMDHLQIMDAPAREIIALHGSLLEKSDYAQLARVLGLTLSGVRSRIEIIKGLDPGPGRKYNNERTTYVVPDIIVEKDGEDYKVTVNDEGRPRLRISGYYRRLLAQALRENPEAHRYLKDKLKKALWFLRSLDQRDQTIAKVARSVVARQREFFEKGLEALQPLTLMEIAREIGVHESTVGRVVANKHMMTPRGTFSLKYFFHKSLQGDFGEEISSLRVKERIRRLVEAEDRLHPLSDMEIEAFLARENFPIARRTVAKYRQQLDILPSHIRKRKYEMEEPR